MILNPPEPTAENRLSCRKMHFPAEKWAFLQKMQFPAERCLFLQKNAVPCRKMRLSGGASQETAGGLQGSRIKNASQLSQDSRHIWGLVWGCFAYPSRAQLILGGL